MGSKKSSVVAEIRLKVYPMALNKSPFVVRCHFWSWAGPSDDSLDIYRVEKARLVKVSGFNHVAAVEEV